ncbi:hypothetical protein FRC14_005841 [Serendipita sp. 396]|nr:hypothetical protein FRC14_005841 [Serendipita sp. 396]KAG8796863.1 hypothetical protein FRC16_009449 [Serendipita sp. 398]KAG8821479.1 hypothetical protein FRC19_007719 [Serendipita sp. 401]
MQDKIILYDISSNLMPKAWSPNTWKARFVLNYKGLPYETVWVSYPDIATLWERLGLSPDIDKSGKPNTFLPIISVPSNEGGPPTVIAESFNIALFLDHEYPDTPRVIPPNTAALQASFVQTLRSTLISSLGPLLVSQIPSKLDPGGASYFVRTRKESWAVQNLEDVAPYGSEKRREYEKKLHASFRTLYALLSSNGGMREPDIFSPPTSPIISSGSGFPFNSAGVSVDVGGGVKLGRTGETHWVMGPIGPTFADFALGGMLYWIQSVEDPAEDGEGKRGTGELWSKIKTWNGGRWAKLMDSLAPWQFSE